VSSPTSPPEHLATFPIPVVDQSCVHSPRSATPTYRRVWSGSPHTLARASTYTASLVIHPPTFWWSSTWRSTSRQAAEPVLDGAVGFEPFFRELPDGVALAGAAAAYRSWNDCLTRTGEVLLPPQ
jgi:hypothetical protein